MNSQDVIDLNMVRLFRKIDASKNEHEFMIGSALLDLYVNKEIDITMSSGEMLFKLRDGDTSHQLELNLEAAALIPMGGGAHDILK